MNIAVQYGLKDCVYGWLDNGVMPTKDQWKNQIKSVRKEKSLWRWRMLCITYKKIAIFRQVVTYCKPIIWWKIALNEPKLLKLCKFMVSLLTGNGNLRAWETKIENGQTNAMCNACNEEDETLTHFVLKCNALFGKRAGLTTY